MKSMSSACTSTGMWGTAWQASKCTSAPALCAALTSSPTGLIVPTTFDM